MYKIKKEDGNSMLVCKARLVVKGFGQGHEFDYDEIFSLAVKITFVHV